MIDEPPIVPPIDPADIRSGPMCRRFAFAVEEPRGNAEREQRRRAVVSHLVEWLDGVDVVDEWMEDRNRWIVLEPPVPVSVAAARSFAEEVPRYVAGSFAVDRSA